MPRPLLGLLAVVPASLVAAGALAAPAYQSHTAKNGLTVLVVENHAVHLVTVEIAAKNGSMTEPPEYNGLSHLYEHMFFKANAALPSQEAYLQRAQELGMAWNGTTGSERVNYFFTTTSDHLHDSLVFMRDAIVTPLFDPKELDRERVVVTGEIDRAEAIPFYHFNRAIDQTVWWKYPSRKDPLGLRKTVLTATPEKMRTIQKRYYVPNNSALVVTGDVDASKVFAEVDSLYAAWPRGDDPFQKFPLVQHPPIKKTEVVVIEQPSVQTFVGQIVWQGPSTVGTFVDSTYAADAAGQAFGEPSSKFQKDLVDSGACVRASLSWFTQVNTGPISLSFEAAPEKAEACVQAVMAEIARLKDPALASDAELQSAAHAIEIGIVKEREKPSAFAHTLTFWWTSAGLDYYDHYVENLKKVKHDDVVRYVDRFITGKPFVFGALVSPEMAKKGLDRGHFEKLVLGVASSRKEAAK